MAEDLEANLEEEEAELDENDDALDLEFDLEPELTLVLSFILKDLFGDTGVTFFSTFLRTLAVLPDLVFPLVLPPNSEVLLDSVSDEEESALFSTLLLAFVVLRWVLLLSLFLLFCLGLGVVVNSDGAFVVVGISVVGTAVVDDRRTGIGRSLPRVLTLEERVVVTGCGVVVVVVVETTLLTLLDPPL